MDEQPKWWGPARPFGDAQADTARMMDAITQQQQRIADLRAQIEQRDALIVEAQAGWRTALLLNQVYAQRVEALNQALERVNEIFDDFSVPDENDDTPQHRAQLGKWALQHSLDFGAEMEQALEVSRCWSRRWKELCREYRNGNRRIRFVQTPDGDIEARHFIDVDAYNAMIDDLHAATALAQAPGGLEKHDEPANDPTPQEDAGNSGH